MSIESAGLLTPVMFCDHSDCNDEITNMHGDSRQELIRYAETYGWQVKGGHYCSAHRKDRAPENDE